jgi:hypothetical protein
VPGASLEVDLHATGLRQLLRPTRGHHLPAVNDHDPVADELDLREEVGVQEHRHAAAAQLLEEAPDRAAPGRVERARGLVEKEHSRSPDERLRDAEALLHSLGHVLDVAPAGIGEADQLEQLGALGLTACRSRESLVELHQLVRRAPPGEAEQLGEIAHRAARFPGARLRAADDGRAAARANETAADLHEGRLAGAVRAEEADELAFLDRHVDAREGAHAAVALGECLCGEGDGHRASLERPH